MDLKAFLTELFSAFAHVDFVKDIDFKVEGVVVSGRIFLKGKMFLEVYYNEVTETMAFALIKEGKRVWGIDRDNIRDWHIHPVNEPETHESIRTLTVSEIVEKVKEAWIEIRG
jgi:hypothetical protein